MDPFLALHREMNRLFDDALRGVGSPAWASAGWPHTDVVDAGKEYRVTVELPGLEEKDVDLTFQDGVLTVKGEKRMEHDGEGALHSERYYGRFQRALSVGADVDEDKISASFRNGVLTVVLPKSPEAESKAKRIRINAT
ncbi:MAG TPA: Hsp20/alpha crystallin family protein [Azospirillum sp.]|nr:Hsp20/alpha crystallin family protein [Azospirillum sp.]